MKYLTIDEMCEMLSISRRTLERMRSHADKPRNGITTESFIERTEKMPKLFGGASEDRIRFPDPDFYIGKSPRWEMDKLLLWLSENGHRL